MVRRGMTLVEIMIALAIIGIMATVFVTNILSSALGDKIDRAAQTLHNDLAYIRMRSVSTNTRHRIRFISTTEYRLEIYNGGAPPNDWSQFGLARHFPSDTYVTMDSFTNAGSNLESTGRGLYDFQNGMSGDPYVIIEGLGANKSRSLRVFTGGAIQIANPES
jgi:prepilin-type N-terminal cleavage/methylation domain-containing protein